MTGEGSIINEPKDRIMTSMGYTFSFNDIDVGIIGTQNPKHLLSNIDMYKECLEMPKEVVNELNNRFDKFGKIGIKEHKWIKEKNINWNKTNWSTSSWSLYVGALETWLEFQDSYESFFLIADYQALGDNF